MHKKTERHARDGAKTTVVFLPADAEASHLVVTSKFGLFSIRWCSATRKHLFLYPQGNSSGLRKPKRTSINNNYSYHQHSSP